MRGLILVAALALLPAACSLQPAFAADRSICERIDPKASVPITHESDHAARPPAFEHCTIRISPTGHPLPDPACTPGAVNPTVTIEVLRDPAFRTSCVRDKATKPAQKAVTYKRYGIPKPKHNRGQAQTCELDHLCSLELGCADTIDNIWPQCGPAKVGLKQRFFKMKDAVENYLAKEVRAGRMGLHEAQEKIAADWTQFLAKVRAHRKR